MALVSGASDWERAVRQLVVLSLELIAEALLLGCLLGAGAMFIAPRAQAQTNLLPIRIGYQSTPNWLLLVAKNMNLFEKAGLAPTFSKYTAGINRDRH